MNFLLVLCTLSVVVLSAATSEIATTPLVARVPKQISSGMMLDDREDRKAEASGFGENFGGFGGGGGGGEGGHHGNYFMYQHLPKKDHYEFGFKRGNEHHHKERHEKAHPHQGHFKTKVRWADKHGGHGEHYWDYNHHGHHGDGDGSGDEAEEATSLVAEYDKKEDDRIKREEESEKGQNKMKQSFIFNTETGTAVDPATGRTYVIYPIA